MPRARFKGWKWFGAVLVIVVAGILLTNPSTEPTAEPVEAPANLNPGPEPHEMQEPKPADGLKEDVSPDYLSDYGKPGGATARDLEQLAEVIDAFIYSVKVPDALPTGGNREMMSALIGDNPYRIRFIDPAFPYLNDEGELVDRWQTPVYFHFVEASDVGIRSAGPDRKMWTEDDEFFGEFADPLGE